MLTQEQLIAYLEQQLPTAERADFERVLAGDQPAQWALADQENIDLALRVLLGHAEAHDRVKRSIFTVLRGASVEQLTLKVMKETRAGQADETIPPARWIVRFIRRWLWSEPVGETVPARASAWSAWLGALSRRPRQRFALSAAIALTAVACGLFLLFRPAPATRIAVGQFAAVVGEPVLKHNGKSSPPGLQSPSPIHLGDRIETGDADKAEIVFKDGTTLRLGFNTSVEFPTINSQPSTLNPPPLRPPPLRPPEINLLRGQVWTKVQKMTNAPQYAIRTVAATAVARGTEFGVKLEQPRSGNASTLNPQPSTPTAVLTVKEGAVDFSNALGSVQATAMTESTARADAPPTEPKRLQTLQVVRLNDGTDWHLITSPLDWPDAAERLSLGGGWAGLKVRNFPVAAAVTSEIRVIHVSRNSPAASAGLRIGDLLIAVDGQPVSEASQITRALLLRPDITTTLTLRREGTEASVNLVPSNRSSMLPGPTLSASQTAELDATTRPWIELGVNSGGRAVPPLADAAVRAAAENNLGVILEADDEMGPAIRAYGRAVSVAPQVPLYHFNLGLALRKIGSFERALEEFESTARLHPGSILVQKRLAEIHSLLGRDTEALAMTDALLLSAPQDHGAWELKAQLHLKASRPAEAREAASRAVELDPDCVVAHEYLAEAFHDAGQLAEAQAAYEEALGLSPFEAVLHVNLGTLQRDLGQPGAAEQSFRRAIELRPDFALAYFNLGDLLMTRRDFASAEAALRKALELDPNDVGVRRKLGTLALQRREFAAAEEAFHQALELAPNDPEAFYGLGETYRLRHRSAEAERAYRKATEIKPDYAAAQTGLGIVFHERGEFDEAEKLYHKAIELYPKASAPYNNLGNIYREAHGNPDEAEKFYRRALELAPNDADPQSGLGLVAMDRGNLVEAERLLRRAVELAPYSSTINNSLGEILRRRGRLDEAESFYKKALELDADYIGPYGNLGILHAMRRQFDEAEKMFRALLQRTQGKARVPVLVNLASVCGEQGKLDEADKFFQQALELSPGHPRVSQSFASFLADHQLKLEEALALATRAVQAEPKNPEYLDTLGWVQLQRGELEEAEKMLKQALELAGQEPPQAEIREHLKKLGEKKGQSPK